MSKPRKKQGNPDFRHRVSVPAPASEEIESRLLELINPGTFANLKGVKDKERSLRSRVLTLPVMAAIVLSKGVSTSTTSDGCIALARNRRINVGRSNESQ